MQARPIRCFHKLSAMKNREEFTDVIWNLTVRRERFLKGLLSGPTFTTLKKLVEVP
jgi:predicted CopG family antitoxin